MPHKHKPRGKWSVKRYVRALILNSALFEREKAEVISQVSADFVSSSCLSLNLTTENVPDVIAGEVLKDPYGHGSFQLCGSEPTFRLNRGINFGT